MRPAERQRALNKKKNPSKATKTKKRLSRGGHALPVPRQKGKASQAQLSMVSTSSEHMLAITVNSSPIHAMSWGRKKLYS